MRGAVNALPVVPKSEVPTLVRTILRHVVDSEEAGNAWSILRPELEQIEQMPVEEQLCTDAREDPVMEVAHIVITSFADPANGALLAACYLKRLESITHSTGRMLYIVGLGCLSPFVATD